MLCCLALSGHFGEAGGFLLSRGVSAPPLSPGAPYLAIPKKWSWGTTLCPQLMVAGGAPYLILSAESIKPCAKEIRSLFLLF